MNYAARIASAYANGTLARDGAYSIEVSHSAACGCRSEPTDTCTCQPDITVLDLQSDTVLSIGTDGHLIERRQKS